MSKNENSQHSRVMNLKYKSKYMRLKRRVRNFLFENAAICDEVTYVQAEVAFGREDRRDLIKRLLRYEAAESPEQLLLQEVSRQEDAAQAQLATGAPKKRGPKKRIQPPTSLTNTANTTITASTTTYTAITATTATTTTTPTNKANKARARTRDKVVLDANGKPMFPINLYNILVHSPGEIIPINPNFHTPQWVYPVGYVATRIYAHPKDPQRKCVFTCKILNNAGVPQFQIIPDNDLDSVFFGETAGVCHLGLLEAIQRTLSDVVKLPLKVQGEKFFGLANPTVKSLMQLDAGFGQCANFKGFCDSTDANFTVSEEKDPTLNYEALQSLIAMSVYHTMPEVKEEPPDELFDFH